MPTQEQSLNELTDAIVGKLDVSSSTFGDALPLLQKRAYARVVELIGDLDTSNGNVKVTAKNLKILANIRQELVDVIKTPEYEKSVGNYIKSFDAITELNRQYFSELKPAFEPSKLFDEIKKQAVQSVSQNLLGVGLEANIALKVEDILKKNIQSGTSFADLTDQVRVFLTDTDGSSGALVKYAKTYAVDAINTYNSQYTQLATDDLGLEWYKYNGSLLTTSRPFCKHLIDAKSQGMEFIHKSQFPELLKGRINGQQVPLNKKTGLPEGLKEGTNVFNLTIERGGYGCGHQFMPVSSAIVPKALRDKYEN